MKTLKLIAAVAATIGLFALVDAPAKASTISLTGGTAGTIPDAGQTNDVLVGLGFGNSLAGFFGTTISLVGSSPVLVEFLGYEASYSNSFSFAGSSFNTETDDPTPGNNRQVFATPPSFTTGSLSGLLAFLFSTGGGTPASVANGANPDDAGNGPTGVNFFASVVDAPTARSGRSVVLFFDDNGANNDDDHDDMVVRLSVAAVPVPATLPLLFGAIAGLGFVARRRTVAACLTLKLSWPICIAKNEVSPASP